MGDRDPGHGFCGVMVLHVVGSLRIDRAMRGGSLLEGDTADSLDSYFISPLGRISPEAG